MLNKYPFFKYIPLDSKVHKMNSKMKILWLLLSSLCILLLNDYVSVLFLFLSLLFMMGRSKVPIEAYVCNLLFVWPLYVVIFIIGTFFTFDFLVILYLLIKAILLVLLFLIITFTTSLSEIAWGFDCLFVKLKKIGIPVSKWSLKVAMGIKFISTLFEQFRVVRKSMAYRGVSYNEKGIRTFKKMFIPVIKISYKLSSRMVVAMKLRFYGNSSKRTNYHDNKVTKFDKYLIFMTLVIIYITIWLGWLK